MEVYGSDRRRCDCKPFGETCETMTAKYGTGGGNTPIVLKEEQMEEAEKKYIVRRLTPLECERLQGFPDEWTLIIDETERVMVEDKDPETGEVIGEHEEIRQYWLDSEGKRHKSADSQRYKALGNSIATGENSFWEWMLKRISAQYDYRPTLGSLFDGIGGFPLIWSQINGVHNCRWASEIEEFPIAVTKRHFGDEDAGIEGDFWKFMR